MTALADRAPSIRLEVRGLAAAYGPNPALRGLDARIFAGEIVAILGENGSGKSTLLKVIARILPPASGEVLLDGRPLSAIARRETARRIAYVAQSGDLVFPIRSLDLVLQGRAPHGRGFSADSAEDRERALAAMRACDVAGLADRDASALSGGERRRVFLARALAQEAEVWLLDEPTSGLDPRHRIDFLDVLVREHRARATTILLVTHEVDLALSVADRVLLLREGRALASGTPEEALTPAALRDVFGVDARVDRDASGRRRVVWLGRAASGDGPSAG
ncbi:MAG: ABC transporter ATP-binding protein [Acidobacteriota bacterium]